MHRQNKKIQRDSSQKMQARRVDEALLWDFREFRLDEGSEDHRQEKKNTHLNAEFHAEMIQTDGAAPHLENNDRM